ncbi:MAG: polyprenol monophosphomannose synthase [Nitrososphaerota archaeon]
MTERNVAVVIPTYNEAGNIGTVLELTFTTFSSGNINGWVIVVDDNSPDGTADVVESIKDKYGKIVVIRRPRKLGLGSAYKDGFALALEKLDVEYLAEMDADGSHPPEKIPLMLDFLMKSGADCVVASRYVEGGSWGRGSSSRTLVSKGANLLARLATGIKLKDMTSGYRLYKAEALRHLKLDGLDSGYVFQVQIIYELAKNGFRVVEYPFVFMPRLGGKSKLGKTEFWRFFKWCIKTMLARLFKTR